GRDTPTLREFVRQFRGLSHTGKAKAVCGQTPGIARLGDFEDNPEAVGTLLRVMQDGTSAPSPDVLGCVGKDHFRSCFEAWYGLVDGDGRCWYRKVSGTVNGIPFHFEAAVAHTLRPGRFFHGFNFSPTFGDPLAGADLFGPEF